MDEAAPQPPDATAVEVGPAPQRPPGVDTDHLRDYRALRRDGHDRKIAGVCGGLARHLDVDPTLVRVVMVVLALFGGAGLLLYGALWLFVPEHGSESGLVPVAEGTRNVVVVVALVVALLIALPSGFDGDAGAFVGLLILGTVVAAVLLTRDSARRRRTHDMVPYEPAAGPGTLSGTAAAPPPPGRRASPRRRGPLLIGLALASVVLALGVLGTIDVTGTAVPDAGYPALALAMVGTWLVIGSVAGRPGGLVLLGLVCLVALGVAGLVEPTFEGERERVVRPSSADELRAGYDVPAGSAEIDLRGVRDLEALDGRRLDVDVNAGEIVLIVPEELTVDLEAQVSGGGEISTPDLTRDGWGVDLRDTVGSDSGRATIHADLQLGFGSIEVRNQ